MRNVLGVDEDFPTDFVLVLETSPEKSDYENEDDEDDPASVFLIPFFQLLASDFIADPGRFELRPKFLIAVQFGGARLPTSRSRRVKA